MSADKLLPPELVFRPDGHLCDEALDVLADGEEALLPAEARAHLDHCGACSARLGDAALLTLRTSELLAVGARAAAATAAVTPARAPQRAPLPLWHLAAAVIIAALGALPAALEAARDLPAMLANVQRSLPLLVRGAVVLMRYGGEGLGPPLLVLLVLSAATLLVVGISMARALSRKAPAVEGSV